MCLGIRSLEFRISNNSTVQNKAKLYLKIFIIAIVVSSILGYAYLRTKDLIGGPQVNIHSPEDGTTVDNALIVIRGTAKNISSITLNDRQIFTDEQGRIQEEILLIYGYNILEIKVRDRFGREAVETLELVYK